MQMGGRVFRLHDDLPVKQMVQSGDTKWPFVKTAMPLMQYVWQGDDWKSLQVNPRLNQINQNARIAIATTDVELPEFIKKERGRGRSRVWRP
jgi:tricorn protease-like protein